MSDNSLKLRNKSIQKIYDSYLYAMDQIMTFYLSCVVFDEHAVLTDVEDYFIRASYNFCDEFTTIKKVKDVKNLIENNTFQQLYRKQTLVSQISILEYYFSKLVKILRVPKSELEKPAELSEYGMNFFSKNATICRIHAIARFFAQDLFYTMTSISSFATSVSGVTSHSTAMIFTPEDFASFSASAKSACVSLFGVKYLQPFI